MVEIYRNSWFLIVLSITTQYWHGISTNNATNTTEAMQNSSILQEDIRRIHLKKHMPTNKTLCLPRSAGPFESHKHGRLEDDEECHQYNINTNKHEDYQQIDNKGLLKLSKNPKKYKLKIKLNNKQDQDMMQYPRDTESYNGSMTHYPNKAENQTEKTHDVQLRNRNIEIYSKETTNKKTFVTMSPHMKEFYMQRPLAVLSGENQSNEPKGDKNLSHIHNKKIYRFHTESRRTNIDTVGITQEMKQQTAVYKEQYNVIETNSEEVRDIEGQPKLRAKSKPKTSNALRSTRINGFIEKSTVTQRTTRKRSPNVTSSEDLSPYAIEMQMKRLVHRHKEIMNISIEVIGQTVEYNSIVLLKITEGEKGDTYFRVKENKYADEVPEKKIIFIVHGLSVMGMRHLIGDENLFNKLLKYYTDKHLEKFDIFLIPMANPDGYAAICNSHAGQYWNKNMSPQTNCPGVALDRNFDVAWNNTQKISSCSPVYPGSMPFSEAETKAVRNVLHQYSHKIVAYIHVHASSYDEKIFKGDAILYPRGYTDSQTDDDKYIDLKGDIDEAMKNSSFRILAVTTDTLYNWYGKVSGSSVDYASTVYGVPYAMEFAMQIYKGIQQHALDNIWGVLIDVVFNNIWKNSHNNADSNKNN